MLNQVVARALLATGLGLVYIGCSPVSEKVTSENPPGNSSHSSVRSGVFTARTERVLLGATRIEAKRMSIKYGNANEGTKTTIVYGPVVVLKPEMSKRLTAVMRDPRTYSDGGVFCFEPGVQIEFIQGANRVTAQICFHCHNIEVVVHDKAGEESNGEPVFTRQGLQKLRSIVREIFPDDPDFAPPLAK